VFNGERRNVAELPDHLRVAEIPCGRMTGAAKRDRTDVTFLARQSLSAHHDGDRIGRLASRYAVVSGYKRKSDVIGNARSCPPLSTQTLLDCLRVFAHGLVGEPAQHPA
jgi:hypothetical protein